MNALLYILLALFLFVCLFMTLLILIQKGRGGGLASAFGGAGGNTAFGSKTGDVLTWATSVVFGVFLMLAIVLNLVIVPDVPPSEVHERAPSGRTGRPRRRPGRKTPTTAAPVDSAATPLEGPASVPPVVPGSTTQPATNPG